MYQDRPVEGPRSDVEDRAKNRVLAWQKDVAKSTADETQSTVEHVSHTQQDTPRIVVNQIITTPAVVVTRVRSEAKPRDEISTKAIVGTLLGATAGALVAYAMTQSEGERPQIKEQKTITYRTIQGPAASNLSQSVAMDRISDHYNHSNSRSQAYSQSKSRALVATPPSAAHVDGLKTLHHTPHSVARSREGDLLARSNGSKVLIGDPRRSTTSYASSRGKTVKQADLIRLPPLASSTNEARTARDIPLPHSQASAGPDEEEKSIAIKMVEVRSVITSVSPKDSVSQVSSMKMGVSDGSKLHGGSRLANAKEHEHARSGLSGRNSR